MKLFGAVIGSIGTAFFSWVFYIRFYKWIDCFNELGRCYVAEEETVYTTAGHVWSYFAVLFLAVTVFCVVEIFRKKK